MPFPPALLGNSLTKSCVFFGESGKSGTVTEENSYQRGGMVGVSLAGDIRMRSFVSQGARRVGPTFHADKVITLSFCAVSTTAMSVVAVVSAQVMCRLRLR